MSVLLTINQRDPQNKYGLSYLRIGKFDYRYSNYCTDITHPDSRNLSAFSSIYQPPNGATMFAHTLGVNGSYQSAFGDNFNWTPTEFRGLDEGDVLLQNLPSQYPIKVTMVTDETTYDCYLNFRHHNVDLGQIYLGYNQGFYLNSGVVKICLMGEYNSAGTGITELRAISYATSVFDLNGNYRKPAWIIGGTANSSVISKINEYVLNIDNKQEQTIQELKGVRYFPTKAGNFRVMQCADYWTMGGETVYANHVSPFNNHENLIGVGLTMDSEPTYRWAMTGYDFPNRQLYYTNCANMFNYTFGNSGIEGNKLGTDLLHPTYNGALPDLSTIDIGDDKTFAINESDATFTLHRAYDNRYQLIVKNGNEILDTIDVGNVYNEIAIAVSSEYWCMNLFICKQPTLGWSLCGIFINNGSLEVKHIAQFSIPTRRLFEEYVETIQDEYGTPAQELSDNTEKTRRGKDDVGTYTEVWDEKNKQWVKTYDNQRQHTGERGKGDGSSNPDDGNERIEEPSNEKISPSDCGLYTIFSPTPQQLRNFSYHLNSSTALEEIGKWFKNNPMDGIFGLSMIPYDIPKRGNAYPSIGNYSITTPLAKAESDTIVFDYGTIKTNTFKECSGDFLDYSSATSVSIFLPHIGFKELDVDLVMGRTLSLKYLIYVATGDIIAYLYAGDLLLYQWQGNCALQLPISHTDYSTCISTAVSLVGTAVASAATHNPIPMALSLTNGIQGLNKPNLMTSGSVKGNGGFYTSEQAYLVVARPEMMIEDVKTFNHTFGRSSAESVVISSIEGYTEFEDIDVSNINCTKEEKDRILDYMKGGFFA